MLGGEKMSKVTLLTVQEVSEDSKIELLYISPSKRMKAYLIKNSIIAIRDRDAFFIEVMDD